MYINRATKMSRHSDLLEHVRHCTKELSKMINDQLFVYREYDIYV